MRKRMIHFFLILIPVLFLGFFEGCATYQLKKDLDPESKEFFSKVRYIITSQEKKIFLNLPKSERKEFIKQFWEKRDPDPTTKENEFKEEYYSRIETANQLFRRGGTPGWLQDRGRVYVLLGPPHDRHTYPTGRTFYDKPEEVWYYGFFPIVFIDTNWNGNYQLTPLSANHISQITQAKMEGKPIVEREDIVFDFNLKIQRTTQGQVVFQIKIPFKNIWFAEKKGIWQTILSLTLIVFDEGEKIVWEKTADYSISFPEENLSDKIGEDYLIQVPADLEPGTYAVEIELENKEDENRISRTAEFIIKE